MKFKEYGPLAVGFDSTGGTTAGYLAFLSLGGPAVQVAMDKVEPALTHPRCQSFIDRLLAEANWRPHLVAAIALILDHDRNLEPDALWRACDSGSWVIPQLVVAAFVVDPEFPERARKRVEAFCPISSPSGAWDRHSLRERSAKYIRSLVWACAQIDSMSNWVEGITGTHRYRSLAREDFDDGAGIAEAWMHQLRCQMEIRGRPLELENAAQPAAGD
jgi:hypothetical protein